MSAETPDTAMRKGLSPTALLVATADSERWQAAVATALANAALGRPTSLYLHEKTVRMLAADADGVRDLIDTGIRVVACQTGMALCDLHFDALPAGIEAGGLISFLAEIDDDRLIVF